MGKTIIKTETEWTGGHAYLNNVDYDLPGWAELPERFQSLWNTEKPFVDLTVNEAGEIIDMAKGARVEPTPEPEHVPTAEEDRDAILVDHEYRITLMELGVTSDAV